MSDQNPNDPFARLAFTLIGFLALTLAAAICWTQWQSRQELLRMPREERHALYEHVLGAVSACARGDGQYFAEYCSEQARYVALFPDCDASCHALSRRLLPRPTK
jgi:hypothetical protein